MVDVFRAYHQTYERLVPLLHAPKSLQQTFTQTFVTTPAPRQHRILRKNAKDTDWIESNESQIVSKALECRLKQVLEQDLLSEWRQIQRAYAAQGVQSNEAIRLKQQLVHRLDQRIIRQLKSKRKGTEQAVLSELLGSGKYRQHKLSQYLHRLLTNQLMRTQNESLQRSFAKTQDEQGKSTPIEDERYRWDERPDCNFEEMSFQIECDSQSISDDCVLDTRTNEPVSLSRETPSIGHTTKSEPQVAIKTKELQQKREEEVDMPVMKPEYANQTEIGMEDNVCYSKHNRYRLKRNPISFFVRRILVNMLHITTDPD